MEFLSPIASSKTHNVLHPSRTSYQPTQDIELLFWTEPALVTPTLAHASSASCASPTNEIVTKSVKFILTRTKVNGVFTHVRSHPAQLGAICHIHATAKPVASTAETQSIAV